MSMLALAAVGSLVLGAAHLLAPALERLPERYQGWLGSFGGGAGLAYVVLYLLYQLVRDGAAKLHAWLPLGPEPIETLFLVLLAALAGAYTLQLQLQRTASPVDDHHGNAAFLISYNMLVGAGLVEEGRWGPLSLAFYVTALGLHMVFNERFLLHLCPAAHTWRWRGALAAAPVAGLAIAAGLGLPEGLQYGLLTLIAGGTIMNVLRHELPGPLCFRPSAFAAGLLAFTALILGTWRL